MLSIINEKFIRFEDGKPTVFAELCVDTAEELPTAGSLSDRTLARVLLRGTSQTENSMHSRARANG